MPADFLLSITLLEVAGVPGVRRCRSASTMIFCDLLKVLAPKIKHLAPQGRTKTLQKRIRNVTLIFHGFYIDFGSHVGDILKVLAASSSQYRLVSCFQMVRFNGQYLKVSAVPPQLQSADTGRCQAL